MPDDKTTKESDRGFAKKFNEKDILTAAWTLAMDQWVEAGTEGLLDLNKRTTSIEGWIQEATHILEELKEKTKKINRWMDVMDIWTATASDSIEELEDKSKREEEQITSLIERMGEIGERVAALEQIYNKSKQAPPPADPWSTIKPQPGPSFYYCPACGSRQITGSFHYCTGTRKTYPPNEYGFNGAATPTAPEDGQRGAATVDGQASGPESGPVPRPPLGGQTEEEIRKAAQRAKMTSPWTVWSYRVDY